MLCLADLANRTPAEAPIIAPDSMPPARLVTRSRRKINRTIDMGYIRVEETEDRLRQSFRPAAAMQGQ